MQVPSDLLTVVLSDVALAVSDIRVFLLSRHWSNVEIYRADHRDHDFGSDFPRVIQEQTSISLIVDPRLSQLPESIVILTRACERYSAKLAILFR